ncbi:hypothetical protein BKA67DRAFT_214333 [Truncatella angustata]|uniref:Zn(2)-C6 fungal-type domain-containing protein n=1 Tax=Truncatella angustata TaxID=152316 RepID=A0A9P9A0J2_9PEZI|nr:uncharacterized protein BKA67DRAFT_214333 [Truncatella angustata]KAH6658442.1 hypothetical protein BKA67DRAFT_214333 [Truncatella angustata]
MGARSARSKRSLGSGSPVIYGEKSNPPTITHSSRAAGSRSKRAKYTAAACDACKRRKLKCIRDLGKRECDRCMAGEVVCSFADGQDALEPFVAAPAASDDNRSRIEKLERELAALRRQVTHLACVIEKGQTPRSEIHAAESVCTPSQTSLTAAGVKERKEVQFVGTTRPAFALNVSKAALSVVDEPSDASDDSGTEPEAPPVAATPSPEVSHGSTQDPLLGMPISAVYRLLDIFQGEIEPMYPLLDTANLRSRAAEMIKQFQEEYYLKFDGRLSQKDIHLLKIVLATALVFENQQKTELSSQLIASFEDDALRITSPSDVDLQEVQVFAIMSVYHFHCDEELLAYRSIGISTRMVLELGLHRRRSLFENYPEPAHRSLAIRVFWCIYALDRRWSFGTGLSFALIDRDIDPQLPQPSLDMPYFQSLVAYGKLCSKVWDAIPHYGSSSESMPTSMESMLESEIQGWFSTIPDILQLTTTETIPSAEVTRHDRSLFQHLQTLLYLRGNYIRCLIHRHHVVSAAAIAHSPVSARLVVSIAQDTIRILVNLDNTSDIYSRHQVAYNFFLISAISIMLLAVCHAPAEFAQTCRKDFFVAIDLVRGFSRLSLQGRRLWSSLRGLVARLRQLGIMNSGSSRGHKRRIRGSRPDVHDHTLLDGVSSQRTSRGAELNIPSVVTENSPDVQQQGTGPGYFDASTPDMNLMGDDLVGVFDTFGRAYMDSSLNPVVPAAETRFDDSLSFLNGDVDDFSEYFMGLI